MEGPGFSPSNARVWHGTNSSTRSPTSHVIDPYHTCVPKHFPVNAGRPKLVLPSVLPRASRLHCADSSKFDTRPKRDTDDVEMTTSQARLALDRLLGRQAPSMQQAASSISTAHNACSAQADEVLRPEYVEYYASSLMQIRHSSFLCASGLATTPLDETLNEVSKSTKFTVPSLIEATIMDAVSPDVAVSLPPSTSEVAPAGQPQPLTCSAPLIEECSSDEIPDSSAQSIVHEAIHDVRHHAARVRASMGTPIPSRLTKDALSTADCTKISLSDHSPYSQGILVANAIAQKSGINRQQFSDHPHGSGINLPFIIAISNALHRVNALPQKRIDISVSPSSILDMLERCSSLPIQRVEARAGPSRAPG